MRPFLLSAVIVAALSATAAAAATVPTPPAGTEGLKIFTTGGKVTATFEGRDAGYSHILFLDNGDADYGNDLQLFDSASATTGSTALVGIFSAGTELLFRLLVSDGNSYFSGPAARNYDNFPHASVQSNWKPGTTLVGFEDLPYGGDRDYNDLAFSFTNTVAPVPLPATLPLLAAGIAGFAALRRRKTA